MLLWHQGPSVGAVAARWGWERKAEVLSGLSSSRIKAGSSRQARAGTAQPLHRLKVPLTHFPDGRKRYPIAQQDLQPPCRQTRSLFIYPLVPLQVESSQRHRQDDFCPFQWVHDLKTRLHFRRKNPAWLSASHLERQGPTEGKSPIYIPAELAITSEPPACFAHF